MDSSATSWLSEMGLDNPIFTDQCDFMDSFDEELAAVLGQDFETCFSPGNNSPPSSTLVNIPSTNSLTSLCNSPIKEPPNKLQKPNNYSNFSTIHQSLSNPARVSSTPIILNFGNANSPENNHGQENSRPLNPDEEAVVSEILRSQDTFGDPDEKSKRTQTVKKTGRVRPPSQTYDHIIAERKRREQLSQRFVALSTIVPGLKKMDKTSVLGDAIKYLKHLQERVKTLEEQAAKQTMESVILVKKSQINMEDDEGSSDEKSSTTSDGQPLPEIEARLCNKSILLRVHCENQRGVLVNLLSQVEKLNLNVVNTNISSFGKFALDITIITEMEKEFNLTATEVVKRLRKAFQAPACNLARVVEEGPTTGEQRSEITSEKFALRWEEEKRRESQWRDYQYPERDDAWTEENWVYPKKFLSSPLPEK
ncbi:hypothetical protein BUALT_Bualt04G0094300 [Buddleja alternifolia]|uniref:BHLH domain-containing protein n=1 Tax=Buddleja alternifolia TaxID=168488 RepID=A0AAV6XYT1_9LAMI|nr:hypothetical protein BUALT_Bualt04G0094300 [Buddleja alternifolia]